MEKIKVIIIVFFLISSCAKTDIAILQKDISRYSAIEKELNIKIKLLNLQMIENIAEYKKTNNIKKFQEDNKLINDALLNLLKLSKEVNVHIVSKEVKKYHKLTTKILEIQVEYVKVSIEQFKNMGEHGNNDYKLTQIQYNRKIRKLQKEQDKLLEKIIEEINNK